MKFSTAGALAALLIGLTGPGDLANAQYYQTQYQVAQYYPAPQGYPAQGYPAQTYPSQPQAAPPQGYPQYRAPPGLEDDDDDPGYDPSMVQRRPLPPIAGVPADEPPPVVARPGRGAPIYQDDQVELLPPPPGYQYREGPRGYELSSDPNARLARPTYAPPGSAAAGAPAAPLPPMGAPIAAAPQALPPPVDQNAVRPPLAIGPGQADPSAGAGRGDARMAALPPEVRPETGPAKELPPRFRRTLVDYPTKEPAGTIVVDTQNTYLYLVLGGGKAMRYGIGVGREGFTWNGTQKVSRMAEWPDWHPPEEMIDRQPYLPRFMAGGPGNPLGARALYLGNTIYRIHGTNQPSTIGTFVSSGCIRLTNEDVTDLYGRVKSGTRVVVLPGKAPHTAPAATPSVPGGSAATAAAPAAASPQLNMPPAAVRPGAAIGSAPLPPPSAMAR
jgi:lipoprotein-anchoring transpeptidase ErfK/SrfK